MSLIEVDHAESVAWVTLRHPPLNILTVEMLRELGQVCDQIHDSQASVVVFEADAEATAFSAGIDVACHAPAQFEGMLNVFHGLLRRLLALPQVTVAALEGSALGAGCELALACDLVVAAQSAELGFPEIKLGCFAPAAVAALPTLTGRAAAADLILTGTPVSAERALAIGMVSRVFAPRNFDEELRGLVAELSQRSPAVLRLTTGLVRRRFSGAYGVELAAAERAYKEELARLPDMAEGVQAFLEKRPPKWQGRD